MLLAFGCVSCANKQDVLITKLRGRGVERTYRVTVDDAWRITETLFRLEPTDAIEEHRAEGYMLTSQMMGPLSSGTYLGVFLEPAAAGQTKVTFVSKRKTATQSYPGLDEASFHRKFSEMVDLMSALKSVCATPAKVPLPSPPETDAGAPKGE